MEKCKKIISIIVRMIFSCLVLCIFWQQSACASFKYPILVHIAVTGKYVVITERNENMNKFDGVTFPIYYGYFRISPENEITFTKKTDIEFSYFQKFISDLDKDGYLYLSEECTYKYNLDNDTRRVYRNDEQFYEALECEMERFGVYVISYSSVGKGDEYIPNFSNTCIFNSKAVPSEHCSIGPSAYFKIPVPSKNATKGK